MIAPSPAGETRRKLIHAATGLSAVWVLAVPTPVARAGLVAAAGVGIGLDVARRRRPGWQDGLDRALPGVFRPAERHQLSGAAMLLVGYALTAALFSREAAAAGILALALGDAAAALVGRAWARRRGWPPGHKTLVGTVACFAVTAPAILVVTGGAWLPAVAGAAAAALGERLAGRRLDNILVPLAAAAAVQVTRHLAGT